VPRNTVKKRGSEKQVDGKRKNKGKGKKSGGLTSLKGIKYNSEVSSIERNIGRGRQLLGH